jgi:hypothetical protein
MMTLARVMSRYATEAATEGGGAERSIPGLVELYATLTTDALQERHAVTREFVRDRFRLLRETLAARIGCCHETPTRTVRPS